MRDSLATKIFTRMGVPAPRQAHARLFVNDTFIGVYVIVEPVDRTFISRVYGEAEAALESGGFLYEYRWLDEYFFKYMGPSLEPYAAMFRAQTRDTDSMSGLYAPHRAADSDRERNLGRRICYGGRTAAGPAAGGAVPWRPELHGGTRRLRGLLRREQLLCCTDSATAGPRW